MNDEKVNVLGIHVKERTLLLGNDVPSLDGWCCIKNIHRRGVVMNAD